MVNRGFIAKTTPTLYNKRPSLSIVAAATERDLAKQDKAITRHANTKTAATERERFVRRASTVLLAPRKGHVILKAKAVLTREQIAAKRKDWMNA
jgi:hypothetical protein